LFKTQGHVSRGVTRSLPLSVLTSHRVGLLNTARYL
jgi:hypothetical protein